MTVKIVSLSAGRTEDSQENTMAKRPILSAFLGAVIGAIIGWFVFASIAAAIGTGSAMAAGLYGTLLGPRR
jgi:hypothetical protein